jgi:hypothetical protein
MDSYDNLSAKLSVNWLFNFRLVIIIFFDYLQLINNIHNTIIIKCNFSLNQEVINESTLWKRRSQ